MRSQITSQRTALLTQVFHENHHFFKALEITGSSAPLILIFFQRTGLSSFLNSGIFKELEPTVI
jgi:hypothetical protein